MTFSKEESQAQRELFKKLHKLKLEILRDAKSAGANIDTINEVLDKPLEVFIRLPSMSDGFFGFLTDAKFSINNQYVTSRYAIDILMPKILLIEHFDLLLQPALNKLIDLEKKKKAEDKFDGQYAKGYFVANEIVRAARQARQQLVDSEESTKIDSNNPFSCLHRK